MNKIFNKLSFPVKLMLLGIIPLAFLIYFAVEIIHEKQERITIVRNVIGNINGSILVSKLATELHLERRRSYRYLFSKGGDAELLAQRIKTDLSLSELEKTSDTTFKSYLKYSLLGDLKARRDLIINRQISGSRAINYYSNVLERIHSYYNTSVTDIPYLQSIGSSLKAQRLMSSLLNQFGVMRASIYSASAGKYTEEELDQILKAINLTFSYTDEFKAKADKASLKSFQSISQTSEAIYTNQVLSGLITKNRLPDNFNAEYWWDTSGSLVDHYIDAQKTLIQHTKKKAEDFLKQENKALYQSVILLIAIIILVISIVLYTINNITKVLNELKEAAEKLALGESGVNFQLLTNDSIGSLAKSIRMIDINNNILAKAADSIGKGNFDISISPRSNKDILGNAVIRMKDELQAFSKENSEKLWIHSGLEAIHNSVKGEKLIKDLSAEVLNVLVEYLGAQVGLSYVSKDDVLFYSAGYAVSTAYAPPATIAIGETLIGEAAKKKHPIYLQKVPEDYLNITSAGGKTVPGHILIIPLVYNEIVEGVIELGSLQNFPEAAQSFAIQASQNIAVALHSAKSRAKLQELLEETQTQAEELQTQHSELEELNTELEAQAQKLQASEEELKVQQEELIQSNEALEMRSTALEEKNQLIVERNLEIQKKAEELEQSTRYKSEFLANMSHELRTPLNSILLLSRLMYENPEGNLNSEQVEYAEVIQNSGQGLLLLIDEILDLSKIEAGKMELEYADLAINELVSDMRSLFAPIARDKNIELIIDVNAETPARISTDKMRLEQIVKNLMSNALKFTSKGSVSFLVAPEGDRMLRIAVKDTGIGIPKESQSTIFEAFQQADGSTKRKFGGTGLGLSISKELARLLGGEITMTSAEGSGSEFTLTVPVYKMERKIEIVAEQETPAENLRQEIPKLNFVVDTIPQSVEDDRNNLSDGDKIILIIEDDTNFAKALLTYTRKAGYKGLVAVRGDEGVEMAATYNPLAILLDIQLPVKDGWQVMEELKSNFGTRHIPVHIMSSLQVKKESLMKGAVDFINKPVAIEQMREMFNKLEQVLTKHPKKVLIIEENTQHAKALAYFLETFNVSAQIQRSVKDSIESLSKENAECVILDMGIPDASTYETLDSIKKTPGLENLPIIIFTGKSISKHEEGKLKSYADSIVMKTAHSYKRIMDEVSLFLHLVEDKNSRTEITDKPKNLIQLSEILKDKTVLIADDDVRNIFSLTKTLEQLKMKVVSAIDGKEAIRVLDENPQVDVILMDMMMPEMDGYESIAAIRKNTKYRNIPILAVTAKAMVGDREKCIQAGASDYISKPVDIDQLISLLRVWLYGKV